jgi:hypothetical protein
MLLRILCMRTVPAHAERATRKMTPVGSTTSQIRSGSATSEQGHNYYLDLQHARILVQRTANHERPFPANAANCGRWRRGCSPCMDHASQCVISECAKKDLERANHSSYPCQQVYATPAFAVQSTKAANSFQLVSACLKDKPQHAQNPTQQMVSNVYGPCSCCPSHAQDFCHTLINRGTSIVCPVCTGW